jgi:DNA repair protein RecN (Recombination protein N)
VLLELRVENLLLIERAELRLAPGLNVVTGETGAGKTVLAHALDLLLGGKPRPGIVRPGANEAWVEGLFALPDGMFEAPELADLRERLPEGAGEVLLGRRVSSDGRTRAFVEGRGASTADLRDLGGRLISFYGQHEHRRLMLASAQRDALDGFCGAKHLAALEEYAACHHRVLALRRELEQLRGRAGARKRDLDLLAFELDEIDAAQLEPGEEESLLTERSRLRHVEALLAAAGAGAEALVPEGADAGAGALAGAGVSALLAEAERLAGAVAGADPELDALAERLSALRIEAEDLGGELRAYASGLEAEPGRLEELEARLEIYDRLKRKHGGSVESVIAHGERCRAERARLESSESALEDASAALAGAEAEEARRAAELGAARRKAGPKLAKAVRAELADLAMEGASFDVRLEKRDELGPAGAERVEFLIAPNPGVAPTLLRDTASGGELSRVMLALMGVASAGGSGTLVFDEVDAGIGGQTARAVGDRLRRLADSRQVVCITHLPQIASLAERHFRIEKSAAGSLARTTVSPLGGGEVVEELCRMLGADSSDAGARRHAKELLAAA